MAEMQQMYQYVADFSDGVKADPHYGDDRPEDQKQFLQYYRTLNDWKPLPWQFRLSFLQVLWKHPEYLYKKSGAVPADCYIQEMERIARDENVDGAGLITAFANSSPYGNVVPECVREELAALDEANWMGIADRTISLAKELGWNGVYEDDAQRRQEKQQSALFTALHRLNAQRPEKDTDSFSTEILNGIGACAESLALSGRDIPEKDQLFALCALMNEQYEAKYAAYKDRFGDIVAVADLLYGALLKYDFHQDVRGCVLYAALDGLSENFAESPTVYMLLQRAFNMEKKTHAAEGQEHLFAVVGHLCNFEAWHDKAYGGRLPEEAAAQPKMQPLNMGGAAAPKMQPLGGAPSAPRAAQATAEAPAKTAPAAEKKPEPDPQKIQDKVNSIVPGESGSHLNRAMNLMVFVPLGATLLGILLLLMGSTAFGLFLALIGCFVTIFALRYMMRTIVMHHETFEMRECSGRELGLFLNEVFRREGWVQTKGPGQVNYRKKLIGISTPVLSLSKKSLEKGRCSIDIWVSGGSYDKYNSLRRMEVVPKMKDRVLDALMAFSR